MTNQQRPGIRKRYANCRHSRYRRSLSRFREIAGGCLSSFPVCAKTVYVLIRVLIRQLEEWVGFGPVPVQVVWLHKPSSLLRCANARFGSANRHRRGSHRKEVVVIQIAVHVPGKLRSLGAEGRAATFEKNHGHDSTVLRVGVRTEPPEASAVLRARTGLAQDRLFDEAGPQRPRGSVLNRP